MNDAGIVTLKNGERRDGIDLQVVSTPARRLAGVLMDGNRPATFVGVHLIAAHADESSIDYDVEVARTSTDAAGAFTLPFVAAGDYILKVVVIPAPADRANPVMPSWLRGGA